MRFHLLDLGDPSRDEDLGALYCRCQRPGGRLNHLCRKGISVGNVVCRDMERDWERSSQDYGLASVKPVL